MSRTEPENETSQQPRKPTPNPGIGMPAALMLDDFGAVVWDAFGEPAYHVGSSLMGKRWRDVDVRLMLDDEQYEAMGLGDPQRTHANPKWVALVRAFSALGREMTGLPIDFQIQQTSRANEQFGNGARSALGCYTKMRTGQIK